MERKQAITAVILIIALLLSFLSIALVLSLKDIGMSEKIGNVEEVNNQKNVSINLFIESHRGERER